MKETVKNYLSNSVKQMVHEGRLKNLAKKGEDSGTIMKRDGFWQLWQGKISTCRSAALINVNDTSYRKNLKNLLPS